MSDTFAYTMTGHLSSLDACLRALEESDAYLSLPPQLRFVAELILDELASNAIKYGGVGCREIVFTLRFDGRTMTVELSDDGAPFDPWSQAPSVQGEDGEVDDIEDLNVGGRGIHMIMQATDSHHYRHDHGRNVNTLTRSVVPAALESATEHGLVS